MQLRAKLSYNTDIFDKTTMARMGEHFCTLVAGLASIQTGEFSIFAIGRSGTK